MLGFPREKSLCSPNSEPLSAEWSVSSNVSLVSTNKRPREQETKVAGKEQEAKRVIRRAEESGTAAVFSVTPETPEETCMCMGKVGIAGYWRSWGCGRPLVYESIKLKNQVAASQ